MRLKRRMAAFGPDRARNPWGGGGKSGGSKGGSWGGEGGDRGGNGSVEPNAGGNGEGGGGIMINGSAAAIYRGPQSSQSEPRLQPSPKEPVPPSSHESSLKKVQLLVQRTAVSSEDEPSDASRRSTRPLIASGHSLRAATAPSASPLLGRPRYTRRRPPRRFLDSRQLAKVHLHL